MNIYFTTMYFTTFFSGLSFGLCYYIKNPKAVIITFILAVILISVSGFCMIKMFNMGLL